MDLVQLEYFQVLAQREHMTQAAAQLHIAQPALSRSLRNLETELELQLFDRRGKSLRLNENGRVLLRHTRLALQELEDAKAELLERRAEESRQVSIGMFAATKLLPDIIQGFQARYPEINLRISQQQEAGGNSPEECDVLVYSSQNPAEKPGEVSLLKEEICLAMPAGHPLAQNQTLALHQAAGQPFICLYKGKGLRVLTDEFCRQAGFVPHVVLESDSPATVRDLIALGVGFAFVPKITWSGMEENPDVVLANLQSPACLRYINMAWNQRRMSTRALLALRSYLQEFFARLGSLV